MQMIRMAGGVAGLVLAISLPAHATYLTEDFENGLSLWTSKTGGSHHALLVNDPLNSGRNTVLTFDHFGFGGDLFSSFTISNSGPVTIGFDYLGLADSLSIPGNFGGFLGISKSLKPITEGQDIVWYAGTIDGYPSLQTALIDDNTWHRYEITVDGAAWSSFRLVLEDFSGSGGSACDVYFDNITVNFGTATQVPEPTTAALGLVGGLGALLIMRRRR